MGGGGYNGTLVTGLGGFTLQPANVDNPLKQGFVTVGTDGGHKSPPASMAASPWTMRRWELRQGVGEEGARRRDRDHQEGVGRAPERSYFIGGSQGGHEALDAAARYRMTTTASSRTIRPTT